MLDPHRVMIYHTGSKPDQTRLHMTSKLVQPMGVMYHTNNFLCLKKKGGGEITWSLHSMCFFHSYSTSDTSTHNDIQQFHKSSSDKDHLMVKAF